MKKRIYGFLLGATFLMIGGFGMFTAFEVRAEEPVTQDYLLGQSWFPLQYSWCDLAGSNCLDEVVITPEN